MELPRLLGYDELGIRFEQYPFEVAPGWRVCHGDEGRSSQIGGQTAGKLAQRFGCSVACGHVHRQGLQPVSYGHSGRVDRTLWGCETGNLMDLAQADYLGAGSANWQMGGAMVLLGVVFWAIGASNVRRGLLAPDPVEQDTA